MDFSNWRTPPEIRTLVGGISFEPTAPYMYVLCGVTAEDEEVRLTFTAASLMEALYDGRFGSLPDVMPKL